MLETPSWKSTACSYKTYNKPIFAICENAKIGFEFLEAGIIAGWHNGKNFRTAPYINYACVLLSSKTMTYSQVYWIYTFLIATYFINKNGFRCVRLFSLSALRFPSSFSVSFHSLSPFFIPRNFTQVLLAFFFSLFIPQQASNSLPSSYFWITRPSAIPLHHGDFLKFAWW